MKPSYTIYAVLFLFMALTWLLISGLNLNSSRYDSELQALDDFQRFARGRDLQVLIARVGLLAKL